MKTKNIALINYYASIIPKGQWKIEDVPENLRDSVQKAIDAAKPAEPTAAAVDKEEIKN